MNMSPLFFTAAELAVADHEGDHAGGGIAPADLDGAFLFGCGAVGKMMLDNFRLRGLKVGGLVDNNPALWGNKVQGIGVLSPKDFVRRHGDRVLVLAVSRDVVRVDEQCRSLHVRKFLPYFRCAKILKLRPYEKSMSAAEIEENPEARAALAVWDDGESREKYRRALRFHAEMRYDDLIPYEPDQYFSEKYMPRRFFKAMVDAGAFTGDTLATLLRLTKGEILAYYGFEPDPGNFSALKQSLPPGDSRFQVFPLGLGDRAGQCGMICLGSMHSSILAGKDENGNSGANENGDGVRIATLDETLADLPVTLIKMDIEGFEPMALAGAETLIRSRKPALAISVYHNIEHFWRIPLWIKNLEMGYRLALGCHGHTNAEILCYALPPTGE